MDSYSANGGTFDSHVDEHPDNDVCAAIGTDERRMHVRAYNYWASLLDGRDFPSIEDLDPGSVADFSPHSVLLDFTAGRDDPATPYIGGAIRTECGLDAEVARISDVPGRSLLSRLTDHYLQIIANRAPIGFEAEFVNQRGHTICYRGILMPFSSDGDTIDFIYGVINWKDASPVDAVLQPALATEDAAAVPAVPTHDPLALAAAPHLSWEDGPLHDETASAPLDPDAGLGDWLSAARDSADLCKQHDGRTRAALYHALALAYDFAIASRRVPDDYAELLEDAGVRAQARAPMTPIVKLVFGPDYDKTRLTEFAAALAHAARCDVDFGSFQSFVEERDGGLKGLVAAERIARRPASVVPADPRAQLRELPALRLEDLATDQEFALVLTRRGPSGVLEIVGLVNDEKMVDRAVRRAA